VAWISDLFLFFPTIKPTTTAIANNPAPAKISIKSRLFGFEIMVLNL
jgi:hypothetical protein